MQILREAPAQTIEWNGPTILKTERNPMNSLNVELTVNGMQAPWLLDTGANISVVSQSFAERLGLESCGERADDGWAHGYQNRSAWPCFPPCRWEAQPCTMRW